MPKSHLKLALEAAGSLYLWIDTFLPSQVFFSFWKTSQVFQLFNSLPCSCVLYILKTGASALTLKWFSSLPDAAASEVHIPLSVLEFYFH